MKITKQIEHFNLDHDIVIAVENEDEVDALMSIFREIKFRFNYSTFEHIAKALKDNTIRSTGGFRLSVRLINNIKYYTEEIDESSINGSRIEIVYLKDYTNDLENLKEKINNYIKNKGL